MWLLFLFLGVVGPKSLQKTVSATLFLYFACLMPSIAFGVLNWENTKGALGMSRHNASFKFYGPVMLSRSVNLSTLFLGRLPKRLTSTKCPYFRQ